MFGGLAVRSGARQKANFCFLFYCGLFFATAVKVDNESSFIFRPVKIAFKETKKKIILNSYKAELEANLKVSISDVAKFSARATGIYRASVFNIIRVHKNERTLHSPKKKKSRQSVLEKVNDFDKNTIRRKVHDFVFLKTKF